MKTILVICDNFEQFQNYVLKHTKDIAKYVPVYDIHSVSKILGIERTGIEIRIICEKANIFFLMLKAYPASFGLRPCTPSDVEE